MEVTLRTLDSITPYENNPRQNDAAIDPVAQSIQEFGWRQPIVVDEQGVIVVGHTRYHAALKLGYTQAPVHVATGLTPEQVRAYRLADNQTNTLSSWDDGKLAEELMALQESDYDLTHTGFGNDDIVRLLHSSDEVSLGDPEAIPEVPPEAITKPGDLWLLGKHRLLCGDSTTDDVKRLMDGQQARMLFTDPPWNVAIGGDGNPRHRQRAGLKNDDLSPEMFQQFLAKFAAQAVQHVTGDVYCVLGASEWPTLDRTLRDQGYHWSATIIWVKDIFVLGRSKYHRRYEPIWYGWHENGKSSFQGRRDLDDVWEIPRPKRSEEHPTMKPIELVNRALDYSSAPGDRVLDLFGGSGSTLIAAEQLERQAFLMEIEPIYCDVIVQRWENFTGKKAVRQ